MGSGGLGTVPGLTLVILTDTIQTLPVPKYGVKQLGLVIGKLCQLFHHVAVT